MIEWQSRQTTRWRGVVAIVLAALTVGLVLNRPDILLLAIIGVAFAAYSQVIQEPEPAVRIERRVSNQSPTSGERVDVHVTVHNEGERLLPDIRIVDGVPPALTVSDGSPRCATFIRAGQSRTFSYSVTTARGKHRFEPATVVVRDISGAYELEASVPTETELDCSADSVAPPLRRQTLANVGRVMANDGGSGVEFHRTREYHHGDSMSRIDWNRFALTGELTTIEFRREQTASVILLIDARQTAYRSRSDEPHAVAYSVSAARQLTESLIQGRNHVAVAGLGRELAWLPPNASRQHVDEVTELLSSHETFASVPPEDPTPHEPLLDRLRARFPESAQVILFTPLVDDDAITIARTLDVNGHATSVITPTVTGEETPERQLAAVERSRRIGRLRNADIPVVPWDPVRPLAAAIDETASRWSG